VASRAPGDARRDAAVTGAYKDCRAGPSILCRGPSRFTSARTEELTALDATAGSNSSNCSSVKGSLMLPRGIQSPLASPLHPHDGWEGGGGRGASPTGHPPPPSGSPPPGPPPPPPPGGGGGGGGGGGFPHWPRRAGSNAFRFRVVYQSATHVLDHCFLNTMARCTPLPYKTRGHPLPRSLSCLWHRRGQPATPPQVILFTISNKLGQNLTV
jgi:hypothetical protein